MTKDPQFDWRNDASNNNKSAVVAARFGGATPNYLWYELGDELKVNNEAFVAAVRPLFGDKPFGFGDIEAHKSSSPTIGRCLRIRNAANWLPKLSIGGRDCYLYMVGHADDERHFNFEDQWTRARFVPSTRVVVLSRFREFSVGLSAETRYHVLPCGVFVVVETRFDSVFRQSFELSELAGSHPALANLLFALTAELDKNSATATELEVTIVTDSKGNKYELCASMLELAD